MWCNLKKRDGAYYCIKCNGPPLKEGHYKRQCPSEPAHIDAAQWFTNYYAKQDCPMLPLSAILSKLERCRSADCDKLQNDVCTAMGRTECKQRSVWFWMLAGGAVCGNWKPPPD